MHDIGRPTMQNKLGVLNMDTENRFWHSQRDAIQDVQSTEWHSSSICFPALVSVTSSKTKTDTWTNRQETNGRVSVRLCLRRSLTLNAKSAEWLPQNGDEFHNITIVVGLGFTELLRE